jgi:hypothetical protein
VYASPSSFFEKILGLKLSNHLAEIILLNRKNKGELRMKSFLLVLAQLSLVTLVYAFAYRAGYRSAQSKAISVVKKFADPVTCLLDSLSDTIDESVNDEDKNG